MRRVVGTGRLPRRTLVFSLYKIQAFRHLAFLNIEFMVIIAFNVLQINFKFG